jgi:hypothetical protein
MPQPPQFWKLDSVSTHVPLQSVASIAQAHCPPTHDLPPAHDVPHMPQFAGSLPVSTQLFEQFVSGPQSLAHWPALHTWDGPHAVPHAPQFCGSSERSTHAPLHASRPTSHTHAPWLHVSPFAVLHVVPHMPQ